MLGETRKLGDVLRILGTVGAMIGEVDPSLLIVQIIQAAKP